MTWTDETLNTTSWSENIAQIILTMDNQYSINFSTVNINGQLIANWSDPTISSTGWL